MSELVMDPDVETVIIDYLNATLPLFSNETAHAADTKQNGRTVRVIAAGGFGSRISRVLSTVQVTVDYYAGSNSEASLLARRAGGLLFNLTGTVQAGVTFVDVKDLGSARNYPDPSDDRPRYTQVFLVRVKAQVVAL